MNSIPFPLPRVLVSCMSALAFVITTLVQAALPSPAWTLRNPLPTASALRGIAWTGTRYVTVGEGGVALTSTNGTAWTRVAVAGTTALKNIVWSGTKLLATSNAPELVWTSADGLTWAEHSTGLVDEVLYDVIWTGSQFAAVSQNESGWSLLRSADGITWTRTAIISGDTDLPTLWALEKTSTRWIVVGQSSAGAGVAYTSANGTAWTEVTVGGGGLTDVVWTGTQFVAVGPFDETGTTSIFTSATGASWTAQTPADEVHDTTRIIWTGSKLFGFGGSYTASVVSSTDGITWTQEAFDPDGIASPLTAGVWNGTRLVVVGERGEIQTSTTGATWTRRSPNGSLAALNDCVWTGSQWVAVGDEGVVLTSPTGASWTQQPGALDGYDFRSIEWTGSLLIGVGESNDSTVVQTSTDGITWESREVPAQSSGVLTDLAWNRAVAVVVSEDGEIFTSPTGATWTRRTVPAGLSGFNAVTWTGTMFVAVGWGGSIATSPTGTTWTKRNSPSYLEFSAVASSGSKLVAVPAAFSDNTLLTSSDGITWTEVDLALEDYLWEGLGKVVWTGKQFVASVGSRNHDRYSTSPDLLTSADGVAWTAVNLPDRPRLLGLAANGTTFVAVGKDGVILTQPNTPSVQFTLAESATTEYSSAVSLTVRLAPAQAATTSVPFTLSGTATSGTDYTASASPLVFAAGETVKTITITPTVDANAEPDETIILTLGTPTNGVILEGNDIHTLTLLATPVIGFTAASASVVEEDIGDENLTTAYAIVSLPAPLPHAVSIPFTVTGSAKVGATLDYLPLRKSPLVIPAGETQHTITLAVVNDAIPDSNETVIITLGTPSPAQVLLGSGSTFTLTITDTDEAPSIATQPTHKLVAVGQPLSITSAVNGSPVPDLQWLQGTRLVARGTENFELLRASLTHAGSYRLKAINGGGTATTEVAEVAVVDAANRSLGLAPGSTATLTVTTAGTAGTLSYQWKRNGNNLANSIAPDTRITGATTAKLVIKNLASATDDGAYTCLVTQTVGSVVRNTLLSGTTTLGVVTAKPVFGSVDLPAGIVLGAYSYQVPYASALASTPTSFKASGLPPGITIDPISGLISGRTTVALPSPGKDIVISMTNALGTTTFTDKLIIAPLAAGVVGTFHGLLPRDPGWNANVGSRIELTVSSVGGVSGKITTGAKAFPFTGNLSTSVATVNAPTLNIEVAMESLDRFALSLTFNASTQTFSATLGAGQDALSFTGWRNTWNSSTNKATAFKTLHTFAMEQGNPDMALPQGFGYGSFTPVETTGAVIIAGVLADGSAYSTSTFIGPQGQVLLYQSLYGNRGSVSGVLTLTAGATPAYNGIVGSVSHPVTWFKPATLWSERDLVYRDGIFVADAETGEPTAIELNVVGAAYTPPQPGARVMGLPATANNAKLDFAFGGLGDPGIDPAEQQFRVLVSVANPSTTGTANVARIAVDDHAVTMPVLDTKTGAFSGTFVEPDSSGDTAYLRKSAYKGMLVKTALGTRGYGFFLLQQQDFPATAMSPKLSGSVLFGP
ncbi:MAG: Calx-beta domain-containing protein [Verrucomicrobiaceae bacterium]